MRFEYAAGATPLDPDEAEGLIPAHIATQAQLNAWEHSNIVEGERWAFARARAITNDPQFIRTLHKRMFGRTWRWAGRFRTTAKNIGVDASMIAPALHDLCEDVQVQIKAADTGRDEIAARFSHRLVAIHPFANGNGRLSRTCADLLLVNLGEPRFTWGAARGAGSAEVRKQYIDALHAADRGDIGPLLRFARS